MVVSSMFQQYHSVKLQQAILIKRTISQKSCSNELSLTTALMPFLVSSSRETFLNHYRFVGCKGHSLRAFSYFCSWSHSHYWFHSPMYHIWIHIVFYTKDKRISQFKWQSKVVVIQKPIKWIGDKELDPRKNIPDAPILSIIKAHLSAI